MQIRLLVVDIDGTIAGQSNTVNPRVRQAIQEAIAKGIQVALATGRMYQSALRFHREVGSQLPLLAYNGAWIQNPRTGKIQRHLPLSQSLARQLLDYLEQPEWRSRLGVNFYLEDQLYVREITPDTERYTQRSGVEPIPVGDLRRLLHNSPTKVLAMGHDAATIEDLREDISQHFAPTEINLTQSTSIYFEATHPEANKGKATRYLTETLLGLEANNVMAIGDNFNDLEMLKYAGLSIAMGNAPEVIQKSADWVAPDVEEDGAAVAIEKFLLS